jgi:hypothetical protein
MTRTASCTCGQLTVACQGDPVRISMCHCIDCQKRTGSSFGVQARWPNEQVTVTGDSTEYQRVADSGNVISQHFCPQCGSTVYYWLHSVPEVIAVAIGAFGDPDFPSPKFSVYESRRHAWATPPGEEDVEHFD